MTRALDLMIAAQPEAVRRMLDLDLAQPAERLTSADRVWLVGTGTSQHAAELGALMLASVADARWMASADFARGDVPLRSGDVVVLITHTAETAFALASRARAEAEKVPVVPITGLGAGMPDAIQTVEHEQAETYTVSYTSALAVLANLAARLGTTAFSAGDLQELPAAVQSACEHPGIDAVPVPARAMAIVGAGPWGVTAREGALKLREGARMLAEGYDAERLLHGFAVPYGSADSLVLLQPEADPTGLVDSLGRASAAEGLAVTAIGEDSGLPPLLAQIPAVVPLQALAARFAHLRGQDPDTVIVGAWSDPGLWSIGRPE